MFIPLDLAKKHLNLEQDFHEDDEYILGLIQVAEQAVRVHVNDDFDTIAEKNGGCFPMPLVQAALLFIGNMYQNREVIANLKNAATLPLNYEYLINLYRNWNK